MGNYLDADRNYAYDTLNRVITGRVKDTQNWMAAATATSTYQYDELGDRRTHNYRSGSAITYGHDQANRMTVLNQGGVARAQSYDLAGNLTLGRGASGP
jgi:hypothetical protein